MKEDDSFYIMVSSPEEIRKSILESSKLVLKSLQGFEKVQTVRDKKLQHMVELRNIIRETDFLINKFRLKLPKDKVLSLSRKYVGREDFVIRSGPPETELEELQREISIIEERMSEIS